MEEKEKKDGLKGFIKKEVLISLVVGLLIGAGIMFFLNGGFVAKVGGKFITTKNLYNKMKDYYSINLALEDIDAEILNKKYNLEQEEIDEIKKMADGYIGQYEQYGYTKEDFLKENGFKDYDAFVSYLSTDYKRTIYYYDYLETQLEENAVKTKYDEVAFGKVNNKHILVKTSDAMTKEQALTVANEIIGRLKNGEEFDTIATEYLGKYPENIIQEDLGEIGAFDNIEKSYLEALKGLEKGKYTETPVETSYGYHVIYCIDKAEKTGDISRKDKMSIINELAADIMAEDANLYQKTLIKMREEANFKFYDKILKEKYEDYCADYVDKVVSDVENEN